MKKKKEQKRNLTLRPAAAIYGLLYVYAVILTQLLRSPVSSVFFWFMFSAAPISFVFMMLGKALIQVYVHTDVNTTEKNAPCEYEIRVINQSPIPFPYAEAVITQPEESFVRSVEENIVLSLIPFGGYSVKKTVRFPYRGLYEIGVREIYIYDILHIFRLRVKYNNYSNVTVAPRVLPIRRNSKRSVSDIPTPTERKIDNRDLSELNNIREYRSGDTLKTVHWKLSSKTEELQVKEYSTNNDRHTYIFADLSLPTPPPLVKKEKTSKRLIKALRETKDKNVLKGTGNYFTALIAEFTEKKNKDSYLRRRAKGESADRINTSVMIDRLIKETSGNRKAVKYKAVEKTVEELDTLIYDTPENAETDENTLIRNRWGGIVKEEFADSLPEYCADAVCEMTVSAVNEELRAGNRVTVVWYSEDSLKSFELFDSGDFDTLCHSFATAPLVGSACSVGELTDAIGEAVNVTVRIVTSNIDPKNLCDYCNIPASFGGAGCGCYTEVLLFNPAELYCDTALRNEYVDECRMRLRHAGADMTEIKEITEAGGETIFISCDLL